MVADRDQPELARRIQHSAESGDFEGFNAIVGALTRERDLDLVALDVVKRDAEFRKRITDVCHEAWERKHSRPST